MESSTRQLEELMIDVGGRALQLTRSGDGPALLWLHGGGPGASGMSNFAANVEAFADFTNLVVDQPRFGRSSREPLDGEVIPANAAAVLALLDALELERVSLLGNSMGGGVAAWIAAHNPERVERLVLMAPAGAMPDDLALPEGLPVGLRALFGYFLAGPDPARMREFCELMMFDPALVTEELVEARYRASDREPELDCSHGIPRMGDLKPHLGRIRAPTLCLWGREDRFLPVAWSLAVLAGIVDCRLVVEPHCGHWVQYEKAASFNRIVGEFLREA